MTQNRLLTVMVDHKEVTFVKTGVKNARQDRLVVWQELLFFFRRFLQVWVAACLTAHLRILLLNYLHERADIDI